MEYSFFFFLSEMPLCLFCKQIHRNLLYHAVQPVSVSRVKEPGLFTDLCLVLGVFQQLTMTDELLRKK